MRRAKIAPTLRLVVGYDRPGPIDPTAGEARQAWAELRALLAVAKEANHIRRLVESCHANGGQTCLSEWALVKACERLDRVSRGE